MASNSDIITRWVKETRNETPRYLTSASSNVKIGRYRGDNDQYAPIYSYGQHFELGRWVPATTDHRGYWLLNGDTYSVSTSRHQNELRAAVRATGETVLILPFTPLASAGIDRATIVPIEITDDRNVPAPITGPISILPDRFRREDGTLTEWATYGDEPAVTNHGDGTVTWHRTRHLLGEAVFTATYRIRGVYSPVSGVYSPDVNDTAAFLSGFDAQETRPHYFLAQLPAGSAPISVKDAFEMLRPAEVKAADVAGQQVTRQGDVFAVPTELTTRELHALAPSVKGARLLGLGHIATEVIAVPPVHGRDERTFARGTLTHRPLNRWGGEREPEHRRQTMGDRKTWHLIVKNTVPVDENGESRAWSRPGNVD